MRKTGKIDKIVDRRELIKKGGEKTERIRGKKTERRKEKKG